MVSKHRAVLVTLHAVAADLHPAVQLGVHLDLELKLEVPVVAVGAQERVGRVGRCRADQFAEELEMDRMRVYAWSAVRCIQSAFWSLVDSRIDDEWGALFAGEALA